ncbi:glycerophosphodiester phosphodiesterase [Luteococcus peritonei]|uniref:Glycerophosphodiester phosphodiesterase n=1 Tax=Luteococcus peritonei TaxID=88874 RepID=A0ABW4RUI9_9ACTN
MTSIWAHRGASNQAPENTLAAITRAVELGADGVEIDVQRSADGQLVVIHDETVDRTTNGSGRVVQLEWPELSRLDASGGDERFTGERLPLLEQVLELLAPSGLVLNVELKDSVERYPGLDLQVDAAVRAAGMTGRVWLSSFNHVALAATRDAALGHPIGLLHETTLWRPERYAADFGAQALHPHHRTLHEPGLVDRIHEAGLRVHPWTVDAPEDLRAMFSLGVDAVITNHVERALELRG